jgi:hypothetical protein
MKDKYANLPESDKKILRDFLEKFSTRQWLLEGGVMIVENHPSRLCRTLVIDVLYDPLVERKELYAFAQPHNLAVEIVVHHDQRV